MSITLTETRAKITATEAAIGKVLTAQGWGKGDKNVQRAQLAELEKALFRLRRDERELVAAGNGARNPGALTAAWS